MAGAATGFPPQHLSALGVAEIVGVSRMDRQPGMRAGAIHQRASAATAR